MSGLCWLNFSIRWARAIGSQLYSPAADGPYSLDISRLPALVNGRLGWAVEPKNREITLAGHGAQPVALFAVGRIRTEVKLGRTVDLLRRLVARAKRGERLTVVEPRSVFGFVERQ